MRKTIKIKESNLIKIIMEMIDTNEMSLSYQDFHNSEDLSSLRKAINSNKIISVAFVKKDGEVRHMAIKKYLSSYIPSDKEKTEKQSNVESNNDMMRVVDINFYIKSIKSGTPKESASKSSWRTITLPNVLGFLHGGKFKDLRQENDILGRYGEDVYNKLTKNMVKSMNDEINQQEMDLQECVN
jgi:hypothetical protein